MFNFTKKFNTFYIKKKNNSGRNKNGQIVLYTIAHNKFNYVFKINNNRAQLTKLAIITSINYINKNSCFIGLVKYANSALAYIKLVNGLYIGSLTKTIDKPLNLSFNLRNFLGTYMTIKLAPKYSIFCNILSDLDIKSKYAKSAGTYLSVFKTYKELDMYILKLPTGIKKYFNSNSKALLGRNSNTLNKLVCVGKAGVNINKGFKPNVRGVAMNPVDHPHGGRTKTNKPEVSP
jgi:large subunit ribosomal protein L2